MDPRQDNNPKSIINFLIQFLVVAIIFFAIGFNLGQKNFKISQKNLAPNITFTNQQPENQIVDFSLFWKVYETLPQKFIDKSAINGQKLLYGAISGMVRSLGDPYTAFLEPKQNEAVKSELAGSYEGIGIQIGFNKDKRLVVIAPLRGTPAEKTGLKAKDLILKIESRDTFDLTLPEAVDLIRGPAGTSVKLVLEHEGSASTYNAQIQRAKINVKSVEVEFKQQPKGKVAIVKVTRFGDKTDSEWNEVVNNIISSNARAVIVDMRNNPGGLLSSSVHLASEFVTGIVVKQELADGSVVPLKNDHSSKLPKVPVVVLVNNGSASAAEIFAGAIQDYKRGKIVGEKTFGKGTVQDVVDFEGGAGLHITVGKWLTPNGKSINTSGITPDVIIESPKEEVDQKDLQLEKALEIVI